MKKRSVLAEDGEDQGPFRVNVSQLESVTTCFLCSSTAVEPLISTRDRLHGVPGEFGLVRCQECSLIRLSPRPTAKALPDYYPADDYAPYQPVDDASISAVRGLLRRAVLSWLGYPDEDAPDVAKRIAAGLPHSVARRATWGRENIPRWVPGGRALDLGCGAGMYLHRIQRLGWEVTGVDVSPVAVEAARSAYGLTVYLGQLEDAPLEDASFDFIHMSHIIEHVGNPVTTLETAARLLKPSGSLYVETPNAASVAFRWSKERWLHVDTPRHLWLFSPTTLYLALSKAGFRADHRTTFGAPTYAWAATYRTEDLKGHLLASRPSVAPQLRPKVFALTAASRIASLVGPDSGEIVSCWARLATTP